MDYKINEFCHELGMPEEVTEKLSAYAGEDFSSVQKAFDGLFSLKTGKKSAAKIAEFCGEDNNGLKALSVYLKAALVTRDNYSEKGIDDKIFIDTMKIFSRFVNEYKTAHGSYGFNKGWWIYRNLSMNLMRLGLLEFEMCELYEELDGFKEGTKALSVHIPSDVSITRESLDLSYKAACEFFSKYFPDFDYKLIFCHTWFFAPILEKILPEKSKILLFKSDYRIVAVDDESNEYLEWVFNKNPEGFTDFESLPEDTGLQRGLKAHVLSGGKVGDAIGVWGGAPKTGG